MFDSSASIIIHRDRPHTYQIAETYPRFVTFYRSGEILSENDQEMVVRIESSILGLPTSWTGHGRKTRYKAIEFIQTEGLLKGLIASWRFQDQGTGTLVTINSRFQVNVPVVGKTLEWLIGTVKVRRTIAKILKALKEEAESTR